MAGVVLPFDYKLILNIISSVWIGILFRSCLRGYVVTMVEKRFPPDSSTSQKNITM
jgi:hypothetical protein